jgi:hypothetical protein
VATLGNMVQIVNPISVKVGVFAMATISGIAKDFEQTSLLLMGAMGLSIMIFSIMHSA